MSKQPDGLHNSQFAIGDQSWPGISKLVEEMGELNQIIGKLMGTRGEFNHWSGDLEPMLYDEMGDVLAAIQFVTRHCLLDAERIAKRAAKKLDIFEKWHRGENDDR